MESQVVPKERAPSLLCVHPEWAIKVGVEKEIIDGGGIQKVVRGNGSVVVVGCG
jgi:hypothetical protein